MRHLDGTIMGYTKDSGIFMTNVYKLCDERAYIREPVSDERITNIVLEGLLNTYEKIYSNVDP